MQCELQKNSMRRTGDTSILIQSCGCHHLMQLLWWLIVVVAFLIWSAIVSTNASILWRICSINSFRVAMIHNRECISCIRLLLTISVYFHFFALWYITHHNSIISACGFGFVFMWRLSVNGSFFVQPGHAWDVPSFANEPNQHFLHTRCATLPYCLRHLLGTSEFLIFVNLRQILHRGGGTRSVRAFFFGGIIWMWFFGFCIVFFFARGHSPVKRVNQHRRHGSNAEAYFKKSQGLV
jgi:hypothetical protein